MVLLMTKIHECHLLIKTGNFSLYPSKRLHPQGEFIERNALEVCCGLSGCELNLNYGTKKLIPSYLLRQQFRDIISMSQYKLNHQFTLSMEPSTHQQASKPNFREIADDLQVRMLCLL
jgi:hypothetical protein